MNSDAPRILIVDDDPSAREILTDLLSAHGYTCFSAADGYDGLAQAKQIRPDLVLLDVMMPGITGIDTCRLLRAEPTTAAIPVIMVTALDDRKTALQAVEAGADDLLTKPYERIELLARLRTITRLNRYRLLLEHQERTRQAQARLAWALEHSQDGYIILDGPDGPDGRDRISYANPQARIFLVGDAHTMIEGRSLQHLIATTFRMEPELPYAEWITSTAPVRYLIRPSRENLAALWLALDLHQHEGSHGQERVIHLVDVSDRIIDFQTSWSVQGAIAHKLRTPLVGLLGSLSLVHARRDDLDRKTQQQLIHVALDAAERLKVQIEQVLHINQISRDPVLMADRCPANSIATIAQLLGEELGAQMRIEQPVPADHQMVLPLSNDQIELILRELIGNSQKFHPQQQPHITLEIEQIEPKLLQIRLSDDGIHIAPEALELVWLPFYQAEKSFTGQVTGMGTGLSVIARMIWSIGGRCWMSNRHDQRGIVVTLHLPMQPFDHQSDQIALLKAELQHLNRM